MRRMCVLACVLCLGIAATALCKQAGVRVPIPQRVALADVVVIGRVTGMEDKDIDTVLVPGGAKGKARIALVKVGEVLLGDKELKTVRVALPLAVGGARLLVNLQTGKEYLLLLHKHPDGNFLVCPMQADAVLHKDGNPKADTFDKDLTLTKRCLKVLAEPLASLKSKDADERLFAASILLYKYRLQRGGKGKQEPIDLAESKLILSIIKEADWSKSDDVIGTDPQGLFGLLGVGKNEGWVPPPHVDGQDGQKAFVDAARAWVGQNMGTYRIKRFVP